MEKRVEDQRFEFILYINNKIICQRFFNIKNQDDSKIVGISNIKQLMDNITGMNNGQFGEMGIIPNNLKEKTMKYLWDSYNPNYSSDDDWGKNNPSKRDTFQFEIKIDKKTIGISEFSGVSFPPKVRYDVDIISIVPEIINEIKYFVNQGENLGV